MTSDSSLLEIDRSLSEDHEALYSSLMQNAFINAPRENAPQESPSISKKVLPTAGCCIKCRTKLGAKVFVNLCTTDLIPDPPEVSEEELVEILSTEEAPDFRMPMSIGEPHTEVDNAGKACTVIDVAISISFFNKLQKSHERPVLHSFFCTAMLEGIQEKYKLTLENEVKVLKHKKSIGSIQEQLIRTRRLVREIGETVEMNPVRNFVQNNPEIPKYTFIREPPTGIPEFLIGEMELPKCVSSRQILLDVGGDRVLLDCRPFYFMDLFFPFEFQVDDVGSQFNVDTKILTVTIPLVRG